MDFPLLRLGPLLVKAGLPGADPPCRFQVRKLVRPIGLVNRNIAAAHKTHGRPVFYSIL